MQIGIEYEKRIDSSNTLDQRIVKEAQKDVVTSSLSPVRASIDKLIGVMKDFGENQEQHFTESIKISERLVRKFEETKELHESNYADLMRELLMSGKINEEALRNAIVLRSILSVFLLAYKTGRIIPNEKTSWEKMVPFVIRKSQELSIQEIQQLTDGGYEDRAVVKLANELWTYIKEITPDF